MTIIPIVIGAFGTVTKGLLNVIVFNWNYFEMRLLDLRINFYL